jgi:hypothetical protein
MQFDEYVSLGSNCEGAFQIRRILGRDSPSYFNWNITELRALHAVIARRFAGVLQPQHFSAHHDGSLLNDELYGYKFHSPFDRKDYQNDPEFDAKIENLLQKGKHLVDKFLRARPAHYATVYFYKVAFTEDAAALQRLLPPIRDCLAHIHGAAPFCIVAILGENQREPQWELPLIYNRYLRRIAPWDDAQDGHAASWDRIFWEFPHTAPMRFAVHPYLSAEPVGVLP